MTGDVCYAHSMINKSKAVFLAVFLLTLFLTRPTFAQTAEQSQRWICLNAVRCDKDGAGCGGGSASPYPAYEAVHRARLTMKDYKPLAGKTYIFECLSTPKGQICTLGYSDSDSAFFGGVTTALPFYQLGAMPEVKYKFEGFYQSDGKTLETNPVANPTRDIGPFEWQSSTTDTLDRKFFAMNFFTPGTEIEGDEKTQQQGTFDFVTANEKCDIIKWDPFGRVFDSLTLEPVFGASIQLLKKRADGSFTAVDPRNFLDVPGGNLENPYLTLEDGQFSFVVPDGDYKLVVQKNGYTFPVDVVAVQANYSKIYSDIYPAQTGDIIVQKGKVQHRDIPIISVTGEAAVTGAPKMMEYFYSINKAVGVLSVEGRSSYPFTKVNVFTLLSSSGQRSRLFTSLMADQYGRFSVDIDTSKFNNNEYFGAIDLVKTDLSKLTARSAAPSFLTQLRSVIASFVHLVLAQQPQTGTITFDPIPNYIEGYAYDSNGKTLANANVAVYLTYSGRPYYQTKTNSTGYYKISSEYLPSSPYKIVYSTPTGVKVETSTSKFVSQNQTTLAANSIDLNSYKNSAGKVIPPPKLSPTSATGMNGGTGGVGSKSGTAGSVSGQSGVSGGATDQSNPIAVASASQTTLLTVVVVIFMVLVIGGILVFYLIKSKKSSQDLP